MKATLLSLSILAWAGSLSADEIQAAIDEGIAAYENGKYSEAAGQFDLVSQLLREKSGGAIAEALPEPPEGWQLDGEADVEALGAGFMGGMTSVSQAYADGSGSVTVRIVADSPMIAQMAMLFSNPAMVRQMGQKMVPMGDSRGILASDNGSGTLTAVVANRYLVTIEGSGVGESDLVLFGDAVDTGKLAGL